MKRLLPLRFLLAALFIAVGLVACAVGPGPNSGGSRASCCLTNVDAAARRTDRSIYQLESRWTNDLGRALELGALEGRVQVVAMVFTSCNNACPIIVHDLQRIEAALSP